MESINPFAKPHLKGVFQDKKILLGICGSIAAYKSVELIRALKILGAQVQVIVTKHGLDFVTLTTLETLSENPVFTDAVHPAGKTTMPHIELARWADIVLIAPATAGTLARLAQGSADDLLTTEVLAFRGPLFIAPAMNPKMWTHPATLKNTETLKSYGYQFLGPDAGVMACGDEGIGRLLEPSTIIEELVFGLAFRKQKLSSVASLSEQVEVRKVLITLGPTQSPLDPVRFLSNHSTGVMGAHLAWQALCRGYDATIVMGQASLVRPDDLPRRFEKVQVSTADQMHDAVMKFWPSHFAYLGAAAVLDWSVQNFSSSKIKKELAPKGPESLQLELKRSPDILADVCKNIRPGGVQWVLGFAAETQDLEENALQKIMSKGCHFLFGNPPIFGAQKSQGVFYRRDSRNREVEKLVFALSEKSDIAAMLFQQMERSWNFKQNAGTLSARQLQV